MRNRQSGRKRGDGITRRDFLEGSLLAAGGAAVSQFYPLKAFANPPSACDPDGGLDREVLRGGNLRQTFDVGHWLRDKSLSFEKEFGEEKVTIAPGAHHGLPPRHDVIPAGDYDLIIVGGGISGLATAFFARQIAHDDVKILILENNPRVGGNASRDDGTPLPVPASAAGAYFAYPYDDFLFDFYGGIGIDWDNYIIPSPIYSYYFDADVGPSTTCAAMIPGTKRWVNDAYSSKGISEFPFVPSVVRQFQQARQTFRNWYVKHGAPTDPPDLSHSKYDYLAFMSLRKYLEIEEGFDPVVADFYDQYSTDSLAAPASVANAHSAISFLGAEYNALVSAPGGLSFVARKALKALIPDAFDGTSDEEILSESINADALDMPENPVRYRTGVTAVRCDQDDNCYYNDKCASVHYWDATSASFLKAKASAVVLAGQMYTARHLVDHLFEPNDPQRGAMDKYLSMPAPTANVVVRNSHFLVDAEVGYNFYWYGDSSRIWQDAVVADWTAVGGTNAAENGYRRNALTFYSGAFTSDSDGPARRMALLNEPFSTYEDALREDLNRIFASNGFDFDRDVCAVHLYRWGHALVAPATEWLFGKPERVEGDRHWGRSPLGRISFAGQDSEGNPAIECAIYSGLRAAQEVASFL